MDRKGLVDSLCQVIGVQKLSTARRERRPETGYSEMYKPRRERSLHKSDRHEQERQHRVN